MENYSFDEIVAAWEQYKRPFVKLSTFTLYQILIGKHLLPFFTEKRGITQNNVQTFVIEKTGQGLSEKTVRDMVTLLKGILRFGYEKEMCRLPAWDVRYPVSGACDGMKVLSTDGLRRLARYLRENFSWKNLGILIAINTGMRIGEVCGLQWQDIDREKGVFRVSKTVERIWVDGKSSVIINTPKTKSSRREVPVSHSLMNQLRPFLRVMNPEHYIVSCAPSPCEPRILRNHFKRVMSELGMDSVRFHGLRHSFATKLIETGCDTKSVSVILGHSSVTTTMNLYVHPTQEQKRKGIDKMVKTLKI